MKRRYERQESRWWSKANHVMDELYEEFAGMNMAEIMQDQMMSDNTSVIGGVKNKLGKGAKKMSSLEFHSWHGATTNYGYGYLNKRFLCQIYVLSVFWCTHSLRPS